MKYTIIDNKTGIRYYVHSPAGSKQAALERWLETLQSNWFGYYNVMETSSTDGFSPETTFHVIEQKPYRVVKSRDLGK